MLAEVGVVQFPKSDFKAGWLAVGVVPTALVEVAPARGLVMLEKMEGATVVLLMEPKRDDVMLEESVEAGFAAVTGEDRNPAPAAEPPKMGLNVCTEGLTSGADVVGGVAVGGTAKMGLNPEANRGLLLVAAAEETLLVEATAETGLEKDAGVVLWPISPKGPEVPGARGVLGATEI